MLARQLAYITYVRGSMSTLQIHLFLCFYEFMPPGQGGAFGLGGCILENNGIIANYGKRSLLTKIKHPVVEILRLFKQPMSESVVHI